VGEVDLDPGWERDTPPPPEELRRDLLRIVVLPAESGPVRMGPLSELFLGRAIQLKNMY